MTGGPCGSVIDRFWALVREGPDCWLWTASTGNAGYGGFALPNPARRGKVWLTIGAHRMAWYLTGQDIPKGIMVCHRCNNKLCVRPSHLYLGTALENIRDARADGLLRLPRKSRPGESNPRPALRWGQVGELLFRSRRQQGGLNLNDESRLLGVKRMTLARIVERRTWRTEYSPSVGSVVENQEGK